MSATTIYVPLEKEDEGEQSLDTISRHGQRTLRISWRFLHLLIIAFYTTGFLLANRNFRTPTQRECVEQLSSWCERYYRIPLIVSDTKVAPRVAPALGVVHYEDAVLDSRVFGAQSIFKGQPSAELDQAWDDISLGAKSSSSCIQCILTSNCS